MVEFAAGTDPSDPLVNPETEGHFVFFMPYNSNSDPQATCDSRSFDFSTDIVRADVAISMDTTGSMGGEIANLKNSLINNVIPGIVDAIPDTGMSVNSYDDFPVSTYGNPSYGSAASGEVSQRDEAFKLRRSITTLIVDDTDPDTGEFNPDSGKRRLIDAVEGLAARGGSDGPESGWEMLYQIATGAGFSNDFVNSSSPLYVPPFSVFTATDLETEVLSGEEHGAIGGVGYREDAYPIVIWITDATSHNSVITGTDGTLTDRDAYTINELTNNAGGRAAATQTEAIAAANVINASVISVISDNGWHHDHALADARSVALATGAVVPPEAWDDNRPTNCTIGQCCTGHDGSGVVPIDGQCPLAFEVDGNGNGLGSTIVTAVQALVGYSSIDVSAHLSDDDTDGADALAAFVKEVGAYNASDYASDHDGDAIASATTIATNAGCNTDLTVDQSTDATGTSTAFGGANNRFPTVNPGSTAGFNLEVKCNTSIQPIVNQTQLFKANINVHGNGDSTLLDEKDVYFLIPPRIEQPFIPPLEELEDSYIVTPGAEPEPPPVEEPPAEEEPPPPVVIPQTTIIYR